MIKDGRDEWQREESRVGGKVLGVQKNGRRECMSAGGEGS